MTNCPDLSATARSYTSPSRSSSTVAPGAARPAITASPVGSMRATSNVGTPSLFSGGGGDPVNASTMALASAFAVASGATRVSGAAFDVAGALVAALVSAGGRLRPYSSG